ncbi:sugar ABC transporter permease [Paraburkholderia sp. CNPSo 3274]|uniref:carbohydrate ABC transporter permease n=1 Tax=Paraburkholderia sp. CNPSo 3274 TaxID=2940932 RepID=UPI0020B69CE4|nr:sugar ABC transporter permease [Paraburkholderia sp. CNPSo 3274]MCP3711153.1 sugar ABC transporter permease [Paraburkholderia sp. CNPSo 3274]
MASNRSLAMPLPETREGRRRNLRAPWSNALFVLPFLIVYVLLLIVPLCFGWWLSLERVDLLAGTSEFIGIRNYLDLTLDPIFRGALRNTFYFVILTVPVFVLLGLALALVLNRPGRFGAALRALFFGSSVLSVTIVTLVWKLVMMPGNGLLADMSHALNFPEFVPLMHEATALPAIAVVTVWWIMGLPMMLFLAALQQIPQELYEAAALDSASRWRTFTKITLPSIWRTVALVAVIEAVLQFQLFGQAQLLTDGGPNNSTRPLVQFIYETGFRQWSFGYSAAAAQVLFALMLIGVVAQAWLLRKKEKA